MWFVDRQWFVVSSPWLVVSCQGSGHYGGFLIDPVVAFGVYSSGEVLSAGEDDAAFLHDMDDVGDDELENSLVVGDDEDCVIGAAEGCGALGDGAEGIDVQAGIGLVHEGEARVHDGHL